MKAWEVRAAGEPGEVLHLVERQLPEPGPGEVRIRVTAAGLGLPDVFMCRGTYPLTPPLPFTSGQEATGVVTALGDGIERLAVGDHVMCVTSFIGGNGSFAEECLTFADGAFAVPEGLTAAEAAGFWIPHLTGWIGLVDRGRIAEGDELVVLGAAGGSGIAAVQLGKALGARVTAVCQRRREGGVLSRSRSRRHAEPPRRPGRAPSPRAHRRSRRRPRVRPGRGVRSPRTRPARWPATGACWRSGSPAASGRASRRTIS